jgi:hypothetical protein
LMPARIQLSILMRIQIRIQNLPQVKHTLANPKNYFLLFKAVPH